ncbi:MAG: NAD(P)-dependent oxidoreductase, partial [Nitrospira sp.]|nr:NAD(P)-dependent oxidoreductase [Nitrospira sp.]
MTNAPRTANPVHTAIGWIGTGVMGLSMCGHLMRAGYRVTLHSRTKAKAQPLLDAGATWAESPKAVAAVSDILFTMVGFPQDVRTVYLHENGIMEGARPGTVLVDMTTTDPSLSREIAARATGQGVVAIDAPVSGGDVGARNATLSIMAGGERAAVQAVMPLFELLGKKIVHQGGAGTGQQAKLCNQIVIAGTMVGVCESVLFGFKAGLDLNRMLDSIRGGAAACWTLDHLAPRMLQRNFDPGFFV